MSDVVSGSDWMASEPSAEKIAEGRERVEKAAAVELERRRQASSAQVREQDGWSNVLSPVPFESTVIARSPNLELDGDVLVIRVRCRECKAWSKLRCESEEGSWRWVSPAMLKIVQRFMCELCSVKDDEAAERARTLEALHARLKVSGMPEALAREVSWESMIAKSGSPDDQKKRAHAIDRAKAWSTVAKPAQGLLLWGPPGTGKTRLAATAAVARLAHSPLKWVSVGVLMAELAGAWNDEGRKQALKVLTSTAPVVLDDFDKINPTEATRAQLFTALDKREQAKTAVIVTTNLKPVELEKKLGEVIVSRLIGMCEVLPFPGVDRRLEMGE